MDNQLTPYSAYFKLYDPKLDNLQVAFNVTAKAGDSVAEFVNKYKDLVEILSALGLTTEPAGLEEGEKIQEVDGWVLGETANNGQPCVHLYLSRMEWKVATVYQEKIDQLPIEIGATKPWDGAAPTREQAEKKKVLHPCHFKIVMVDTGKTSDKGNKIFRYDRLYGTVKPTAQDAPDEMPIDAYPDLLAKLTGNAKKLADWGRTVQAKKSKTALDADDLVVLIDVIDETIQTPGSGEILLSIISGLDPIDLSDGISGDLVAALLKSVPSHIEDGDGATVANPAYKEAHAKALMEMWLTAKRYTAFE
jgi:hypothetical protein